MFLYHTQMGNSGTVVIILHGLMGSSVNWRTVQGALSGTHRVICLDLPNHGKSPHAVRFDLRSLSEDVAETMDALGVDRAVVMGHSLGGKVAMQMASAFPGRVLGLVAVDITPRAFQPVHLFVLRACQQLDLSGATRRAELDEALAQSIPQAETRDFLLKNVGRDADGAFAWRVPLQYLIDNYQTVSDAVPMTAPYHGPALFVAGENSPFHVERDTAMIQGWFPAMRLVTIPQAGHLVHADNPEAFIREMKDFLLRQD